MEKRFIVEGMSCSACSAAVERAVSRVEGVNRASVNLLAKTMICDIDEKKVTSEDIVKAVSKAGFEASEIAEEKKETPKTNERSEETLTPVRTRLIVSFSFLAVLMYISMGHMIGLPQPFFFKENALVFAFTQLLLTIPVVYVNRKFFIVGWKAVKNKAPNMDTLVATGSLAGIVYGIFAIYMIGWAMGEGDIHTVEMYRHNLYFESSAMILTLVTLGKFFEERSKNRTGDALRGLERLRPETVTVERDGRELEIPFDGVSVGDTVVLHPGSRAAVDGVIAEGCGSFDMSVITGESLPVEKGIGDSVVSGGSVIDARIKYRATSVGRDTTLSQMIKLVENAAATKAPVARLADKISRIFVPTVMAIAIVTFVVWMLVGNGFEYALSRALSVLVISCPCALGLATPVAITVSVGRLAGDGILVKNASWAETMAGVKTVVFDKTGTVTTGRMKVSDVVSDTPDALLRLARSLEGSSRHPLATAITEYTEGLETVEVTDFRSVSGRGVEAMAEGCRVLGGNKAFMVENGVDISEFESRAEELSAEGKTAMYFAVGSKTLGIIAISDTVKEGARETVEALKAKGIHTVLLTGDNRVTAKAVADGIGVDELIAEVMPADKESHIRRLKEKGRVAMVGDGVNDSPSLAAADMGISMGSGTDIAIDASDAVLMGEDIRHVVRLAEYSRSTLRIIKQNLFWAFIYNIIGIPIAAGVFAFAGLVLNPMIGAAAMSFSSVFVVTNALRLLKK